MDPMEQSWERVREVISREIQHRTAEDAKEFLEYFEDEISIMIKGMEQDEYTNPSIE